MTLEILAIRDRALNAYMRPFVAQSVGQAIRMFQDEINRVDSEMNKHPDDYDLYHLGQFHENTGALHTLPSGPEQVAIGKQLVNKE